MELQDILSEFERNRGYFPGEAVREAMARREEVTPRLLDILWNAVSNATRMADEPYIGHIYAMYLLAAFREHAAHPLLIEFARLPDELPHQLGGDVVTESLAQILASTCNGDLAPIKSLIEDPEVDDYVREAALDSLVTLVSAGRVARQDVIEYFRTLFHGGLEKEPSHIWGGIANAAADLRPVELMPEIREAYDEGLVDPRYISLRNVEEMTEMSEEAALQWLHRERRLIDDPVAEMSGWHCFKAKPKPAGGSKVGRNEPCPCGSGKKYKKCCASQ